MKMKSFHELVMPGVGLLLLLGIWSAALEAVASQGTVIYQLSDGDNVTCRPIGDQHSLQGNLTWNSSPSTQILPGNSTSDPQRVNVANQTFELEIGSCPDGTYPARILPGTDGTSSVARKKYSGSRPSAQDAQSAPSVHEHIETYLSTNQTQSTGFKGTEVFINLWQPFVQGTTASDEEFSLAQLWMTSDFSAGPLNTIEAGWQVFPVLYGDSLPRLFVFWTTDGYNLTGCYNLDCSGFVQVSSKVLLAGSFMPISQLSGAQYEIQLRVFKDDDGTGDWWLQLNGENVGYWPVGIYDKLTTSAALLSWGGEIVDDYSVDRGHTHTQMGSGQASSEGFRLAAYQRNVQYIDEFMSLNDAPPFTSLSSDTQASCYSFTPGQGFTEWSNHFYFGGGGYSSNCTQYIP